MVAASMRVSKGEHRGTPPPREVPLGAPHRGYVLVNYRDSRAVSGSGNRRSWCRLQPVVSAAHCAGRLLAPPPSGRQQQSRGVGGRTKSADVPRVLARFSVAFQPTKPMRSSRHIPRAVVAACLNDRPSVEQEYQQSSLVFVGHVTATSAVPATASFYEGSPYTIRVKEIFRGRPGHGQRLQRKQEWAFSGGCWRRLSDLLDSQNRRTRNGEQLRQFRQAVGRRSRHFNSPAIEQAVPIDGDLHHGAEEG